MGRMGRGIWGSSLGSLVASPIPEQHYEPSALRADDFFSSLELQSIQAVVPSDAHGPSAANKSSQADDDLEEAEDSDSDLYPPTSHTGGKWKPGCRPDGRSQWKTTLFPASETVVSGKESTKGTCNGVTRLPCPYCQQLVSKSYFKLHVNKHTGAKPFSCRLCGRTFAHRSTLSTHMKHHQGIRKFQCPQCDFRAVRGSMLRRHELAVHQPTQSAQTYSCDACSTKHSSRESLRRHSARHSAEYACSVADCGRTFQNASGLKQHSLTHNGTPPYLCEACGHMTKSAHHLVKHQRRHNGERPFKCPHCDYRASRNSQLHRHSRIHTGLKPYSCPYCSYQCNNQENIRKHILKTKKHSLLLPYRDTHHRPSERRCLEEPTSAAANGFCAAAMQDHGT
ncbi:hypothetical protein HPB47_000811 [Ixodes persulcatus]|uniref:Uncharacterized protein n=1 Tax=Ixodes persulcatus TaxID=34615 RepID=A0AC60PQR6_IXOPE|nr:hypothetical protein HPB47_000811 [Ixodes persulcatus]